MNLIRGSIERPVAVIAAVLMVVMFGIVALQYIPIQLAPDVNRPVITVTTNGPAPPPPRLSAKSSIARKTSCAALKDWKTSPAGPKPGGRGCPGIRGRHRYGQGTAAGRQPP